MANSKTQFFTFDHNEPGDRAAMQRLVEKMGGPPPIYIDVAEDLSDFRIVFPQIDLACVVNDDGLDYWINTLTAAKQFKADRLAAAAEDGG